MAMASLPLDGSAKCAAVVATTPRPNSGCQLGKRSVAFVVEGMPVVSQLDADAIMAEPVHQIGKRLFGGLRTAIGKRLADMAFAAPGQDVPVSACRLGERVIVVAELALLAACQVRLGELT